MRRQTIDEPSYIVKVNIAVVERLDLVAPSIVLTTVGGHAERLPERLNCDRRKRRQLHSPELKL